MSRSLVPLRVVGIRSEPGRKAPRRGVIARPRTNRLVLASTVTGRHRDVELSEDELLRLIAEASACLLLIRADRKGSKP